MQFLDELGSYFNVMFSPAVMVAGLLLWQRTTGESKHCSHQTQRERDEEKRTRHFYCCKNQNEGNKVGEEVLLK